MKELINAYEEYFEFLAKVEASLISLFYVHGYQCPPEIVKRGNELRAKITDLKAKYEI